ncbi:Na(+)/H(+) antiporter subunit B [Virgibacillus halophilus]|uniref:Na(+)/H(+) antiporter subunit B n=1 Tax=Tigheibacillus halophilus TaxID=361280 RepID=A0ABU5C5A0_9BACI|nr:Na(+)/H(+) antiporter subunit B [Virgibacillus halophilus]
MKTNDVILHTVTKIVVYIIFTLAIYLFFSGHNSPGGGFIGGLVLASAFVLLFLAYDIETVKRALPFDFKKVAALGAFTAVATGLVSVVFHEPFLTMGHTVWTLPFFGKIEVGTVMIFESGVALTVVGVVVTIILSIGKDV